MDRFALLHHKCGTVYTRKLLDFICEKKGYELQVGSTGKPARSAFGARRGRVARLLSVFRSPLPMIFLDQNAKFKNFSSRTDEFKAFHVIRDPRDVIVSGYFSHRNSHATAGPWGQTFLKDRRTWLENASKDEGMLDEIRRGYALSNMKAWDFSNPRILELRFENFIASPVETLRQIFEHLEIPVELELLEESAERSSFERL